MTYGVISIYIDYIGWHLIFLQIMLSLLSTIHLSFNLPLTSAIRSYNAENMSL